MFLGRQYHLLPDRHHLQGLPKALRLSAALDGLRQHDPLRAVRHRVQPYREHSGRLRTLPPRSRRPPLFHGLFPDPHVLHRRPDSHLYDRAELRPAGYPARHGAALRRCHLLHHRGAHLLFQQPAGRPVGGGTDRRLRQPAFLLPDGAPALEGRNRRHRPVDRRGPVELLL